VPARKSLNGRKYQVVNWQARDLAPAGKVMGAANTLKHLPGRAYRISQNGIARELAATSLFNNQLEKLPLTRLALQSVIENREQFALRRVRRAVEHFLSIGELPNKSRLAAASGVGYTLTTPTVRQAIQNGLIEIRARLAMRSAIPETLAA
jgi:hypothetical protein